MEHSSEHKLGDQTSQQPAGVPRVRRSRRRRIWTGIAIAVALLLPVYGLIAYFLAATHVPEGSGPAYLREWESAVRWRPEDLMARVELGYAYRILGENAKALEQLDYVIAQEPLNAAARYNRGMVYLAVGTEKKAEEDLWRVLEAEPDHTAAAVALGDYYAKKGQYRSLLVAVRSVAEERPQVARLQYLVGLGYENTGRPDSAEERYRMALKLNPNLSEARDGLERLTGGQ